MAIVGDAYIVVKAITTGFESEVRRAASGIDLNREGRSVGDTFNKGFGRGVGSGLGDSLSSFQQAAVAARKQFQSLVRTGFVVGPILSQLVSTIGTLAGGLVSLASSLVAAAPSAIVLASALTSVGIAAIGLRAALSGVGKAISAGTKANLAGKKSTDAVEQATKRLLLATERVTEAQEDFTKAVKDAQEEIQQLGFDAEDAALSEKKAAIELEKARETLQRVQDLPPNSRARREANLAFEEAELNLRRAKDRNSDLRKEQERLATAAVTAGTTQVEQTDTYIDAQKSLIDALRDQKDAQDALNKAKTGGTADTNFQDALADLSKEAQGFVRYMVGTFIPSLKELRDALGQKLFSQLESGLDRLRTVLFPALKPVLIELGNSIGAAFGKIIDAIVKLENIDKLNKIIAQSGVSIQSYATSLGNIYESFLTLLVAAEPLINRFNKFIENKTAAFADYLNLQEASGDLTKFFNKAGDIAAKIGSIFGNVFGGIANIAKANFAPGGGGYILIEWLDQVTGRFDSFSGSNSGQQKLIKYFQDVAINSKAVLSSLGAFIKVILKAGADPNVGKFWDTLKGAAPIFESILTQLNAAGPVFAEFVVALFKFADVTLTTGAIQNFFKVLTTALNTVSSILSSPGVKGLFDFGSRLLAVFLAFGTVGKVLSFAGKVLAGSLIQLGKYVTFLINPVRGLTGAYLGLGKVLAPIAAAFGVAVGPFLAIAAAIAALVAVLVIAYNKSEIFREAVAKLVTAIGDALIRAFDRIKEALSGVGVSFSSIGDILKKIGDFIGTYIVPIFQVILVGAIDLLGESIALAINIFKGLFQVITGNPIEGLKTILSGLGSFIINTFRNIWNNVRNALSNIPIFNSLLTGAQTIFRSIASLWNNTLGKIKFTAPSWIPGFGGKGFAFPTINLAEGGIIPPTPGGTIARIGEAGRAERVEPLDAQGLSQRDRAMIQLLAGNQTKGDQIFNIYPSPGMDESELASLVSRQIAFQLRRGGA
jgi:hypothetical protein